MHHVDDNTYTYPRQLRTSTGRRDEMLEDINIATGICK